MKAETIRADVGRVSYRTPSGEIITPLVVLNERLFVAWSHDRGEMHGFFTPWMRGADPIDLRLSATEMIKLIVEFFSSRSAPGVRTPRVRPVNTEEMIAQWPR